MDPRQTARLLDAGLLGHVERGRGKRGPRFVDAARVDTLANRPRIEWPTDLPPAAREVLDVVGAMVVRMTAWQPVDDPDRPGIGYHADRAGSSDQEAALDRWWPLHTDTVERINRTIAEYGGVPFLATVAGLVVERKKIVEIVEQNEWGRWRFSLAPAASWADELDRVWLPTGGGGLWVWWPR